MARTGYYNGKWHGFGTGIGKWLQSANKKYAPKPRTTYNTKNIHKTNKNSLTYKLAKKAVNKKKSSKRSNPWKNIGAKAKTTTSNNNTTTNKTTTTGGKASGKSSTKAGKKSTKVSRKKKMVKKAKVMKKTSATATSKTSNKSKKYIKTAKKPTIKKAKTTTQTKTTINTYDSTKNTVLLNIGGQNTTVSWNEFISYTGWTYIK